MRDLKADLNCVTVPVGIIKIKELYAIAEHALNRAITAEAENTKLRKVADIAWNVVETRGMSDVLLSELAGRLVDWETWKEGER